MGTDLAGEAPLCCEAALPGVDVHEHCSKVDG